MGDVIRLAERRAARRVRAEHLSAPARVEFLVDDVVRGASTQRPYAFDWDTTVETNGLHALVVRALRSDGKVLASRTVLAIVANP